MMNRRTLLKTSAALALGAVAPVAFAQPRSTVKYAKLRFGVPSALAADLRMKLAGQLQDLPFEIEWSRFPTSPAALEALASGAIDMTAGGDGNVIALATRPRKAVACSAYANILFHEIVVPKGSDIQNVAGLKGKRVSLVKGAGFEYKLRYMLEESGLKWEDIKPVYLSPPDGMSAFINGSVDAWAIWDPSAAVAEIRHGGRQLAVPSRPAYNFHYANRDSLDDPAREASILEFIKRDLRSHAWVKAHPDQWAAAQVDAGLDAEVSRLVARRTPGGGEPSLIAGPVFEELQGIADVFAESGYIPNKVDVKTAFDARFNAPLQAFAATLPRG